MAKSEQSLRSRAMRFLARREHSREELRRKLSAIAAEGEDVEALLGDLAQCGWLSDQRFAEQAVRSKSGRFGPLKIKHTLRASGVDEETIAAAMNAAAAEAPDIAAVWRSRFAAAPRDEREKARQARFLQGRGFPLEIVLRFLREAGKER